MFVAGFLVLLVAALFLITLRGWWIAALAAVVPSQAVIISSRTDAKYGTITNVLLLAAVVYSVVFQGPASHD